MKTIALLLLSISFALATAGAFAQNIGINETGANPHGSAILDVSSTSKGILVPRMTTAQRIAITGPANGLLVYDGNTSSFWFYDASDWVELVSGTVDGNTLDEAYNQGGAGAGRIITANSGSVSVQGTDGFEVTGTYNSGANIGAPGAGTRMMFNPRKAAFRAGRASGNEWNQVNVGDYSTATGFGNTASGESSFAAGVFNNVSGDFAVGIGNSNLVSGEGAVAFGESNLSINDGSFASGRTSSAVGEASIALGEACSAVGNFSVAMGNQSFSNGENSVALGNVAQANGQNSMAFGFSSAANGFTSTSFGLNTLADAHMSFALGRFNEGGGNPGSWVPADPLFEIGNGSNNANRSNAVTVLKNGNTGLGTSTPTATLHVAGSLRIVNGLQAAGRILVSDANGNATWVDAPTSGGTLDDAYDFGGAGNGRVITADAGAVSIQGTDGVEVTGVFGSGASIGTPGAGTRMFFNPRKAAFRAGRASGTEWNQVNVGNYSTAMGYGNTASGVSSFAAGEANNVSGDYAVGLGAENVVSGEGAIAIGESNVASNTGSFASGQNSSATGVGSIALGENCISSGDYAIAMGNQSVANGNSSVAIGKTALANGQNSTAFGNATTANGFSSSAFGNAVADAQYAFALGRFNEGGGSPNSWVPTDPLFEIGNGVSASNTNNAVTVLKNGNTGIGTSTPTSTLHVEGSVRFENGSEAAGRILVSDANGNATWVDAPPAGGTLDDAYDFGGAGNGRVITADAGVVSIQGADGVEVTGTFGSGAAIGAPGAGTRMFFNPRKGAFRAGRVTAAQWDDANVGNYSSAFGYMNTASGLYAVAFGFNAMASANGSTAWGNATEAAAVYATAWGQGTEASGIRATALGWNTASTGQQSMTWGQNNHSGATNSTAWGSGTNASGVHSTSWGQTTTASGLRSTVWGWDNTASGAQSTAFGVQNTAASFVETVLGRFSTNYTPVSATGWNNNDRLFVIGNGTSNANRSNALTVMKNGNVGIGTDTPEATVHIDGTLRYQDGQEVAGRTLVADDDGNASWEISQGFSVNFSANTTLNAGNIMVFNYENHNRGNNYNLATGVFTAPYDGLYQFSYIEYTGAGAGTAAGFQVFKNGLVRRHYPTVKAVASADFAMHISWTMVLEAGDTVDLRLLGASRTVAGSTISNIRKTSWEGNFIK
ncbi:MAG: hypothetical protein EA392_09920 [Cryomorphaceae bacterium]|nr:MAG: hypothetical protein EA392_09920 [Cryomorphaceae bacterium]